MKGRLIYIMGPSGSGKDTILQGLCRLMKQRAYLAPRVITRPATETERGAISVSDEEFLTLERSGALAMSWRANGLAYGVPEEIDRKLAAGSDVLVNGSRGYLAEARRRYPALVPVLVSVDEETLRRRLMVRGRETNEQIRARLDRNAQYADLSGYARPAAANATRIMPETRSARDNAVILLDNSGPVEEAIRALYQYLHFPAIEAVRNHAADLAGHGQRPPGARL